MTPNQTSYHSPWFSLFAPNPSHVDILSNFADLKTLLSLPESEIMSLCLFHLLYSENQKQSIWAHTLFASLPTSQKILWVSV